MPKLTWIIAGILTTLLLIAYLAMSSWVKGKALAGARAELAQALATATTNQSRATDLQARLDEAQTAIKEAQGKVETLEKEKEEVVQSHKTLEDEMRAALESKEVTISQLQGKLTVNILDRVLFDSGEAELKPDGAAVLAKVAEVLAQHPNLKIHVIGHTDNVPIRAASKARFPSNWELSTARATAAVRFLSEHAGVDPARLGAIGYGEFRPVGDNGTPEGRAQNRRIAIIVLPEEIAAPASAK